ncbi:TetR/AcrR family transcriptional regulator [Kribbella sp. NPDC004536]|uniref:TetR/AcrR family transcriptional regulator n=1 Tax=Kribbella sp. NPDC004536 TaxID=3364106 RepID=UPI0036AD9DA9
MTEATTTRRARLRAQTTAEIKDVALRALTEHGAAGISLRAIARDMGMTAGAIYSYFETRDALITALMVDIHNALADAELAAYTAAPADDAAAQLHAVATAYREWAVANVAEFQLIYGDPIPGYQMPADGPAREAAHRACILLTGIVALGWKPAARRDAITWADLDPVLAAEVRQAYPELPPAALALSIRVWARIHGLVTLEIYGHLTNLTPRPEAVFAADVAALLEDLNW